MEYGRCKYYLGPEATCAKGLLPRQLFGGGYRWQQSCPCATGNTSHFEKCNLYQEKKLEDYDTEAQQLAELVDLIGDEAIKDECKSLYGVPSSGTITCPKCRDAISFRFNSDGRFMARCKREGCFKFSDL